MDNILGKELRYKKFSIARRRSSRRRQRRRLSTVFRHRAPSRNPRFSISSISSRPVTLHRRMGDAHAGGDTTTKQVLSAHDGPGQFLTAAQCNACHNATPQSPLMPKMACGRRTKRRCSQLRNLSPTAEMARLADGTGRPRPGLLLATAVETQHASPAQPPASRPPCLHCHGAMGERQLAQSIRPAKRIRPACEDVYDRAAAGSADRQDRSRRSVLQQWPGGDGNRRAGSTARWRATAFPAPMPPYFRDGTSVEERTFTGNFVTGPADVDLRSVQRRHDRHQADGERAGHQAEVRRADHQLGSLRQLPRRSAADLRQRRRIGSAQATSSRRTWSG